MSFMVDLSLAVASAEIKSRLIKQARGSIFVLFMVLAKLSRSLPVSAAISVMEEPFL